MHTPMDTSSDRRSWQPGEYLPSGSMDIFPTQEEHAQHDIYTLVSKMQGAITAEIQKVQSSVNELLVRVTEIEKELSTTEHRCSCHTPASSTSLSSSDSNTEKSGRKRCIPTALSVSKNNC